MQNAHQTEGLFSYCTVVLHLKVVLNSICHIFMDPVERNVTVPFPDRSYLFIYSLPLL